MSLNLTILSAAFALFVIALMIGLVVKKYIKVKYALVWIILFAVLLIAILVPGFLEWITKLCGFQTASNLIICLFIGALVLVSVSTTAIVSRQNKTIRMLVQENSILRDKYNNLKK